MLEKLGVLEEDPELYMPLRRMRKDWLLRNIQAAAWPESFEFGSFGPRVPRHLLCNGWMKGT